MKLPRFLIVIIVFLITFCTKPESRIPDCINDLIKNHTSLMFLCDTGASTSQYLFQGEYVYVFDPGTCGADMISPVYNSNCAYVGGLGGFTGNLIINGVRFDQNAKFIKTVWTN